MKQIELNKQLEIDYPNVGLKIGMRNIDNILSDVRGLLDCSMYSDDTITIITFREINNNYVGKNTRIIKINNNLNKKDLYKSLETSAQSQWIILDIEDKLLCVICDYLLNFINNNKKIKFKIYINSIAKIYENIKNEISRTNFIQFIENSLMIDLCNINRKDLFYCKRLNNFELKDTYIKHLMYFKESDIMIVNKYAFFKDTFVEEQRI